jgi:hypothetical protein
MVRGRPEGIDAKIGKEDAKFCEEPGRGGVRMEWELLRRMIDCWYRTASACSIQP